MIYIVSFNINMAEAFASAEVNVSFYFYSLEFRLWPFTEQQLNYLQLVFISVVEQGIGRQYHTWLDSLIWLFSKASVG